MLILHSSRRFSQAGHSVRMLRANRTLLVLAASLFLIASPLVAEDFQKLEPRGYVNDFAGTLDAATVAQLTAICTEVDQKAQAQIAIVTVKTLDGLAAQDFATRLFERWKVGYKGTNRGVMILLAVSDHQYWFEVGYGLEPILPDGKVGGFGREMVPLLRQGDTSGAVLLATQRVAEVIALDKGVHLDSIVSAPSGSAASEPSADDSTSQFPAALLFIVFILAMRFLFFFFSWRKRLRRGVWYGGGFGGFGGGGFGGGSFGGGGGGFGGFGGGCSGGGGAGGSW
jgi:uncharacterized protein